MSRSTMTRYSLAVLTPIMTLATAQAEPLKFKNWEQACAQAESHVADDNSRRAVTDGTDASHAAADGVTG